MTTTCNKRNVEHCQDRISDLPDDLMSQVLSLVTTKEAVRTSVLSRCWKSKWTSIWKVDVHDKDSFKGKAGGKDFCRKEEIKQLFVPFVGRTALIPNIKSFCLRLSAQYEARCILRWINAVLRSNVEDLRVSYKHRVTPYEEVFLHKSSLVNVELDLPCRFIVPRGSCFPNLKSLNLSRARIDDQAEGEGDTVALFFPVLETLALSCCYMYTNGMKLEFHAPALTKFHRATTCLQINYSIKIISKRLVEFEYFGTCGLQDLILVGQQVVSAKFQCLPTANSDPKEKNALDALKLFREFSLLKELELSGTFTQFIAPPVPFGVSYPVFHHLVRLVVSCVPYPEGLIVLLHMAPFLKFLDVDMQASLGPYDYNAERVPVCVEHVLEELHFRNFSDKAIKASRSQYAPELHLPKFLLKNGRALKKVVVIGTGSAKFVKRAPQFLTCLSTFPTRSTSLEFVVTDN